MIRRRAGWRWGEEGGGLGGEQFLGGNWRRAAGVVTTAKARFLLSVWCLLTDYSGYGNDRQPAYRVSSFPWHEAKRIQSIFHVQICHDFAKTGRSCSLRDEKQKAEKVQGAGFV